MTNISELAWFNHQLDKRLVPYSGDLDAPKAWSEAWSFPQRFRFLEPWRMLRMPRDRELEDTRLDPLEDWGDPSDVEKSLLGWDLNPLGIGFI